jgi:hypothetical protein
MTKRKPAASPFIRHIEELYRMEIEDDVRDQTQRTVTFNFPAEDASMLAAIAKRFGKSTAAFGGELFAEHVRELFIGLGPDDRTKLAAEADAETTRYCESKGISMQWTNDKCELVNGSRHWATMADICNRTDEEQK